VIAGVLICVGAVFHSDFETRSQKVAQLLLIWVLPFVGAIFVMGVAWNQRPHRKAGPSSDAVGYSLMPGCDGDLNRGNEGDPWGGGHGRDGGGH
jgi:hypothetical protein